MKIKILLLLTLVLSMIGCQKEYLEKKTDKALLVPTTLTDFQNLLDNLEIFNIAPSLSVVSSDDLSSTDANVNAYTATFLKNSYIWAKDIDEGSYIADWNISYQQVFYANVVLDGLKDIVPNTAIQSEWNRIKGSALFHRAFAFYNIAQMYAKPYDSNTANQDFGIPIRLVADVNQKSTRGTLQQTYSQILGDLKEAEVLLPVTSAFQSRPNKVAAQALLARLYLNMEDYNNALLYAKACLANNDTLINYNTISKTSTVPFPIAPNNSNAETIFYARMTTYTFGAATYTTVDNSLYQSYLPNDLRKVIFFTGATNWFKGRYTGNIGRLFAGLARDEVYLIYAECEARIGNTITAMENLNVLLKKRWSNTVTYNDITAADGEEALRKILSERRKELVFRGLRWGDLRRLNKDNRFAVTIVRQLNGQTYTLLPNSNRYTLPIPAQEVIASGIEQNER